MDRQQACTVLNLMSEQVGTLASQAHGSDDADFWASTCSIMESYAELYTVLPGLQCDGMFEEIAKLYIDSSHSMSARELGQIARVYATEPFNQLEKSTKVVHALFRNVSRAGVFSQLGASGVADVAEALSLGTDKQQSRVKAMMEWLLATDEHVSNEVSATAATVSQSLTNGLDYDNCPA